jgi:hypothetical protein
LLSARGWAYVGVERLAILYDEQRAAGDPTRAQTQMAREKERVLSALASRISFVSMAVCAQHGGDEAQLVDLVARTAATAAGLPNAAVAVDGTPCERGEPSAFLNAAAKKR